MQYRKATKSTDSIFFGLIESTETARINLQSSLPLGSKIQAHLL